MVELNGGFFLFIIGDAEPKAKKSKDDKKSSKKAAAEKPKKESKSSKKGSKKAKKEESEEESGPGEVNILMLSSLSILLLFIHFLMSYKEE